MLIFQEVGSAVLAGMISLIFWKQDFFKSPTVLLPKSICKSNQYLLVRLKTLAQVKTITMELTKRVI